MRAMFWRRKNARLTTRLNTLVETSERANKTRRRKAPRVIIDTSYLQRQANAEQPYEDDEPEAVEGFEEGGFSEEETAEGYGVAGYDDGEAGETGEDSDGEVDEGTDAAVELESEILREAIEQLERAEQSEAEAIVREEEALKELEAQRERAALLEAEVAAAMADAAAHRAEAAYAASSSPVDENSASQEAAEQAAVLESLRADFEARETAARQDADLERKRASELEAELAALRQALEEAESSKVNGAAAEADLAREEAARIAAEAERDAARGRAETAEKVLAEIQSGAASSNEQECDCIDAVEADVQREVEARLAAEAARDAEKARAEKAEQALSEANEATRRVEALERDQAAAEARCAQAVKEAEENHDRATALAADVERVATARAEAEAARAETVAAFSKAEAARAEAQAALDEVRTRAEAAERKLAEIEKEIPASEQLESERAAAKAREEELLSENGTLRSRVAILEGDMAGEQAARAESAAMLVAANQRADELEKKISQLGKALEDAKLFEQERDKAKAAEAEARSDADEQRSAVTRLTAEVDAFRQALADAKSRADAAEKRAEQADLLLATIREERDQLQQDIEQRQTTGEQNLEAQRKLVAKLEAALQQERTQLADIKAQREGAVRRADEAQKELADLRDKLAEQTEALSTAERERVAMVKKLSEAQAKADKAALERALTEEPSGSYNTSDHADEVASEPTSVVPMAAPRPRPIAQSREAQEQLASSRFLLAPEALATFSKAKTASSTESSEEPPTPKKSKAFAAKPATPAFEAVPDQNAKAATAKESGGKENRRAKRVASRKLASLWSEGMSAALSCTMLDRSSSGAKLEILADRYNDRINEIAVGDRFTVTLNSAHEVTTMDCEVMWVAGRRCGVRFCGQIRTQPVKPAKRAMPPAKKPADKPNATKALKSLFGAS